MQEPKQRSWPDEALKAIELAKERQSSELWLTSYMLRELPQELFQLVHLRVLSLANNPLTSVPAELFSMVNLRQLELSYTQLTQLPPEVGNLTNLEILDLSRSRLQSLPPTIGRLRALRTLDISRNNLTTLPFELGSLRETILLELDGNPFEEPLPTVVRRGTPELFAYLRSLRSGQPQYEAKVLLVGEGNVGKTSLVAALRGQPFVPDRETTHGIELEEMVFPHPDLPVDIHLNTWDFGGQESTGSPISSSSADVRSTSWCGGHGRGRRRTRSSRGSAGSASASVAKPAS
jgi:internalin A